MKSSYYVNKTAQSNRNREARKETIFGHLKIENISRPCPIR